MTPLELALLIVGAPFLVIFGFMARADRGWHREHDEPDEG